MPFRATELLDLLLVALFFRSKCLLFKLRVVFGKQIFVFWLGFPRKGPSLFPLGAVSSMQEKDHDCGDNAQRDEDEQRDPHANREAVGKRGLTGWDSHEPREPVVEFHSISSLRNQRRSAASMQAVSDMWSFSLARASRSLVSGKSRMLVRALSCP
jgi:hypothetical protein